MSIQDFLVQQGYTINSLDETFSKWMSGWRRVEIPFSALVGHTLESFQRLAKEKGWIEEEKPQDFFDEPIDGSGVVGIFTQPYAGSITAPYTPPVFSRASFYEEFTHKFILDDKSTQKVIDEIKALEKLATFKISFSD